MINMRRGRASRKRRWRKMKARDLNSVVTCNFNPDGFVYHDLLKWMGKENFKQSKQMKPHTFADTGRGILTEETIYPGDVVISIPENLLIKPRVVLESPLGPYMKRYCPDATGQEILSVFLMCEKSKGKASFWSPYIATLPTSYTIPAYCNSSAVSNFPPCLKHFVAQQVDSVKNSFEKMSKLFISLENSFPQFHGIFQYDSYCWAWSSVNTRCVYMECEDHCKGGSCSYHLALAPFLDLLNHHYDAQVKAGFNREQRCYEIKSLKHFKKYSQVFINYGNHSNKQLFVEYGFVLENNFNDIVPVSLDDILSACKSLNMTDKLMLKKQVLLKCNYQMCNVGFCKDGFTWGMDMLLKIICTQQKVTSSLGMFHDICLNESEKELYRKLAREVIMIKLKDFSWLSNKKAIKADESMDEETKVIFSTAHYLCSLEQKMLLRILYSVENSNS